MQITKMEEKYAEYLRDESKMKGNASWIVFPEREEEVRACLRELYERKIPVTVQGSLTGICGGAVPMSGCIMNLSRMDHVLAHGKTEDGGYYITAEPGIPLLRLKTEIHRLFGKERVFWPVQPTESSASVGGIAATLAEGPNAYAYGGSAAFFLSGKMAGMDGRLYAFGDKEGCDEIIQMVLGSEGVAGVFTELTLKLIPMPEDVWGICFFFEDEGGLAGFADALIEKEWKADDARLVLCEYIDQKTIRLIQERKADMEKLRQLPEIKEAYAGMVYLELEGGTAGIETLAGTLMELAASYGSDPDQAWAVSGEYETEKLRAFRHAAAEVVNLQVEANRQQEEGITKLGLDFVWPENKPFSSILSMFRKDLRKLEMEAPIFGHIKGVHLHVNLLPKTMNAYYQGIQQMRVWADVCVKEGGHIFGEHGVGKLKRKILGDRLKEEERRKFQTWKLKFDPEHLLCRGNIEGCL